LNSATLNSATQKQRLIECYGQVSFTVYADFNCPFSYALNERIFAMSQERWTDFRMIQHAPGIQNQRGNLELLSELTAEVAEVRRRLPSTEINVPMYRPSSAAASSLLYVVGSDDPAEAVRLRRGIYRALWVDGRDISDPGTLASLLRELDIELPSRDHLSNAELNAWQSEWANNSEFNRDLPVIFNDCGDTLIGFLLQPELDQFLETGSLVSDKDPNELWQPQKRQRILVLDNDASSLRVIIEQMHDAQIEIVEDLIGLIAHPRNLGMPDLLMVNSSYIEEVSASDWWRNSTNSDSEPGIPIIHILDNLNPRAEAAAFEAGAVDIIARPFHPKLLRSRLKSHLQSHRSKQLIKNFTRVDALTSTFSKREFCSRLSAEWSRGARTGSPLALLMIDVDRLRAYNDTYGHLSGDDCLGRLAKLLGNCVRRSEDLMARYQDGMFAVMLPGVEIESAFKVAQNCLQTVTDAKITHPASSIAPHVTVSIGVAAMVPVHEKSCTLIIEQVENALYQAKQMNSNRVCAFTE
jgi:diguanylate cyclase (GGDEF)-like protein